MWHEAFSGIHRRSIRSDGTDANSQHNHLDRLGKSSLHEPLSRQRVPAAWTAAAGWPPCRPAPRHPATRGRHEQGTGRLCRRRRPWSPAPARRRGGRTVRRRQSIAPRPSGGASGTADRDSKQDVAKHASRSLSRNETCHGGWKLQKHDVLVPFHTPSHRGSGESGEDSGDHQQGSSRDGDDCCCQCQAADAAVGQAAAQREHPEDREDGASVAAEQVAGLIRVRADEPRPGVWIPLLVSAEAQAWPRR